MSHTRLLHRGRSHEASLACMSSPTISSDTLVQPSPNETLMFSPPRESDSTDDTMARLYFGPPTSPEKRLLKAMPTNDVDTPHRRSARSSSPASPASPSLSLFAENLPQRTEPFAENDPPDVLDSECETPDNNHDFQDEPSSVLAGRIIRAHDNPSPPPDSRGPILQSLSSTLSRFQDRSVVFDIPPSPPTLPASRTSSPVALDPADTDQVVSNTSEDLISFISVSTPQMAPQSLPQSEIFKSSSIPTVDDLLSRSPTPPLDGMPQERNSIQQTQSSSSPDINDLNAVRTAGQFNDGLLLLQERPPRSPPSQPGYLTPDSQPSPLRRSKRSSVSSKRSTSPSRSGEPSMAVTPLRLPPPFKSICESPVKADCSPPSTERYAVNDDRDGLQVTDSNDRAKKKRKRKDEWIGNDRFGSPIPESTSIPHPQMPLPRPDPDACNLAINTPQKPFSLTLPQTDHIVPQLNATSTPFKHLDTINRTPARRVPVGLVPNLDSSPRRGPSGTRVFGGTIFRTQALDDPNRSPARRVLVADACRTPSKDLPYTFFSKDRSGIEPRSVSSGRSASVEPVFSWPKSSSYGSANKVANLPFPVTPKPPIILEDDVLSSAVKPRATSAPPAVSPSTVKSTSLRQPTVSSRIPRIGVKPYARPAGSDKSKLPVPTFRRRTTENLVRQSRPGSSGSSSDDTKDKLPQMSVVKHKREEQKPPNIQPQIIQMRQVPGIRAHDRPQPSSNKNEEQRMHPNFEDKLDIIQARSIIPDSPERRTRSATRVSNCARESFLSTDDAASLEPLGVRRTSRLRKVPLLRSDATGTSSPDRPRPVAVKVKKKPPQDAGGFAGLSSLALKNLTINNTAKNQQIVNALEMEVVHREGKRPESPTTKLRTISERQKAEKALQRQERAERRARKLELGEIADSDMDASFMSDLPFGDDGQPLKHRRGPGEEEDYETPERPERPSKKKKIHGSEQEEIGVNYKRVQWDRSLFTAVYLDELPDARKWPKTDNATKSCLAKTAKSLRLDALGNVENAGAPPTHVACERVVVKRFVYDSDDELDPKPLKAEIKPLRVVKSKGRKVK